MASSSRVAPSRAAPEGPTHSSLPSVFTPAPPPPPPPAAAAALTGGVSGGLRGKVSGWDGKVWHDGDLREMVDLQREHKAGRHFGQGPRPSVDAAVARRQCAPESLRRAWRRARSSGQDLAEADLV
jgi:hypothetical protein